MSFPLYLILLPYAVVLLIFAIFALVDAYHLSHYGVTKAVGFLATTIFLAGTGLILGFTWFLLQTTDWTQPATIGIAAARTIDFP